MTDLIVGLIVLLIVGAAVRYIIRAKKQGVKCIGCSAGTECSGRDGGCSGCGCQGKSE